MGLGQRKATVHTEESCCVLNLHLGFAWVVYTEDTDLFADTSHPAAHKLGALSFKHQQPPKLQSFVRSVTGAGFSTNRCSSC